MTPTGDPNPEFGDKRIETNYKIIRDLTNFFFNSDGGTYGHHGEPGFSGDGANLYALVSMNDERGINTNRLVKITWGEFSSLTFSSGKYKQFNNFPIDLYCVQQSDSQFADATLRFQMNNHPEEYLKEHAVFAAKSGDVQLTMVQDFKRQPLDREIKPIAFEALVSTLRNQIIKSKSSPEEFAEFLRQLPDELNELGQRTKELEKFSSDSGTDLANKRQGELWVIFRNMGLETTTGSAVGDKKAMEAVLALKKQFDFESNTFK